MTEQDDEAWAGADPAINSSWRADIHLASQQKILKRDWQQA
jgi:hypothetical protein